MTIIGLTNPFDYKPVTWSQVRPCFGGNESAVEEFLCPYVLAANTAFTNGKHSAAYSELRLPIDPFSHDGANWLYTARKKVSKLSW